MKGSYLCSNRYIIIPENIFYIFYVQVGVVFHNCIVVKRGLSALEVFFVIIPCR